jgi:hypothetical protein
MAYTVEYRTVSKDGVVRTVLGQYDDQASTEFWNEMGVDQSAWNRWHIALSSGVDYVLIPDFPQLSRLASADEGKVRFSGPMLQEIYRERQRAIGGVHGHGPQLFLELLMDGASHAFEDNGEVVVHPFGTA